MLLSEHKLVATRLREMLLSVTEAAADLGQDATKLRAMLSDCAGECECECFSSPELREAAIETVHELVTIRDGLILMRQSLGAME